MRRFLKRYSGFARCSMEVQLAYRKSFFVQSISSLVGIMVSIFLWKALFAEQSTVQGYDWNQMILYALIAALVNATMSFGLVRLVRRREKVCARATVFRCSENW